MRGVWLQVSLLMLLPAATAPAQTTDDFAALADRHKGSRVMVMLDSGESATGRLAGSTTETVTVSFAHRELVYQRKNVDTIYRRGTAVKKGMLIGVLAGAALGVVAISSGGNDDYTQAAAGLLVPFGFLVGTGVGAAIPTTRVIFNAGRVSW